MEVVDINYDFYKDYLDEPNFLNIFTVRKNLIKNRHDLQRYTDEYIIQNYFVEIFSWTVFPLHILHSIDNFITSDIPDYTLVDPCCGSSFHGALFHHFCNKDVISIDIQSEECPWLNIIDDDGISYLKLLNNMNNNNDDDKIVLLLSWVDWTSKELAYNLLTNFKGKYVISVGNYTNLDNKRYLDELSKNYTLIKGYLCNMPWKLTEDIKIFEKNNQYNV